MEMVSKVNEQSGVSTIAASTGQVLSGMLDAFKGMVEVQQSMQGPAPHPAMELGQQALQKISESVNGYFTSKRAEAEANARVQMTNAQAAAHVQAAQANAAAAVANAGGVRPVAAQAPAQVQAPAPAPAAATPVSEAVAAAQAAEAAVLEKENDLFGPAVGEIRQLRANAQAWLHSEGQQGFSPEKTVEAVRSGYNIMRQMGQKIQLFELYEQQMWGPLARVLLPDPDFPAAYRQEVARILGGGAAQVTQPASPARSPAPPEDGEPGDGDDEGDDGDEGDEADDAA
jgi:hypothetical protein